MIKVTFSFEFNPNNYEITNIKLVNKEKVTKSVDFSEPVLLLHKNIYELSLSAIELLNVKPGDKLKIQYKTYEDKIVPVIAPSSVWGEEDGNKITKALTVSCRGIANDTLQKYGEIFLLEKDKNFEGAFILIPKIETPEVIESEATWVEGEVPEKKSEDVEEIIEVKDEPTEEVSLDEDVYEIKDVNFEELIKDLS